MTRGAGEPERLRPRRLPLQLLHPLGRRGEAEGADFPPAGLELDFGAQITVSSTECIIIRVRPSEPRNWPTSPAEWNVDPLVSCERSIRTESLQPNRASA